MGKYGAWDLVFITDLGIDYLESQHQFQYLFV